MARQLALRLGGVIAAAGAVAVLWTQVRAVPASAAPPPLKARPAAASSAAGAPAGITGVTKDGVSSFALAPTSADMQRVASYWSPDRLKKASSYEPSTKPSPTTKATTSAAEVRPAAKAGATKASAKTLTKAFTKTAAKASAARAAKDPGAPPMVGKVFFKVGDKEYWCSASAVHSPNHNLVATAGHCAYALAQDKPVENWIFVPSYHDGVAPAGIFVGHTLFMHEDFAGKGDFDRDYAFVTVHRGFTWQAYTQGGKVAYRSVDVGRLEDKVGAFRFSSTKPIGRQVLAFGYPNGAQPDGTRPYTGQVVKTCSGATEKKFVAAPTWQLDRGVRLAACPFTSGASGGPWVTNYDSAKRTGYLTGITSLTWNLNGGGRLDAISTPYFNAFTKRVYTKATRQSTG
ncbi:serine protease [Microbispora sp. NPDC049125]|uniref:trypsin-like serine peptidase n=1 Tax=Microbispora sp. NPDC049125 TaxID=3154929 RepID=UPI0034675F75